MHQLIGDTLVSTSPSQDPRRIIGREIHLGTLPPKDAAIYIRANGLSEDFVTRRSLFLARGKRRPCLPVIHKCMDEKEADGPLSFKLSPVEAVFVQTAGNKLGDNNPLYEQMIQDTLAEVMAEGRLLLPAFVTHESKSQPDTDSCAAWSHNGVAADVNAVQQVRCFNRDYVIRGTDDEVRQRLAVAVRLKSYTDLETHVWFGEHSAIDPLEFMRLQGFSFDSPVFTGRIFDAFRKTFPIADLRFSGLTRPVWNSIIEQMVEMFVANMEYAEPVVSGRQPPSKSGHAGRRVLVGRGWELMDEVGEYFKVSDLTPDLDRECYISGKYVLRNSILALHADKDDQLSLPFHVNVPFAAGNRLSRTCAVHRAMALARSIRADWTARLTTNPPPSSTSAEIRERFLADLSHALHLVEPKMRLPDPRLISPDILRFYISVSSQETLRPVLVATGADL